MPIGNYAINLHIPASPSGRTATRALGSSGAKQYIIPFLAGAKKASYFLVSQKTELLHNFLPLKGAA